MTRARTLLRAALLVLCALVASSFPSTAQIEPEATGPEAGRVLAAELANLQPDTNAEWKGVLTIRARDRKTITVVPVTGRSELDGARWRVIYESTATNGLGAQRLTVTHITNSPNQYLFAVAPAPDAPLGAAKTLTGLDADIPLANSDFWLSDLGFEFYHWPDQLRMKGDRQRGRSCWVLESANPQAKPGGYSRVVTWIDEETGSPIQAEAYGADGKLLKMFEIGSLKKVNGRYELKNMNIKNERTGSRTQLEFDLETK